MTLEEFKKKTPKRRRSKLDVHRDAIMNLVNDDYTLHSIVEYLKIQNCKTSMVNLSKWLKRQQQTPPRQSAANSVSPSPNQAATTEPAKTSPKKKIIIEKSIVRDTSIKEANLDGYVF